jgi:hypothetical protein
MLRRLLPLPLAALAVLTLAATALAGGWAQVTVPNPPADPPAGEATTIELNVLQHGVTAVSWPRITVIATNEATEEVTAAQAKASGPEGRYTATLTFPSEGEWTLSFVSPELQMDGTATLSVLPPIVPAVAPVTTAMPAFDVLPLVALAILALFVVIAVAAVVMRNREGARATQVTART